MANVGNSRVYKIKGKDVIQITTDDTKIQEGKHSNDYDKDTKKFTQANRMLTRGLGKLGAGVDCTPSFTEDSKDGTYVLTTKGTHDCISEKEFVAICRYTPHNVLARMLVTTASKSKMQRRRRPTDPKGFKEVVLGGKNASAAVLHIENKDSDNKEKHDSDEGRF